MRTMRIIRKVAPIQKWCHGVQYQFIDLLQHADFSVLQLHGSHLQSAPHGHETFFSGIIKKIKNKKLFSGRHIPSLHEFIDKIIYHTTIRGGEFFSTTTLEVITHEFTIRGLQESHRRIYLMSNICTISTIFCHLDNFIESATSFSQCCDDVFSVVLHKKIPYHMVWL